MSGPPVVSNASPLIGLERIGQLDLMRLLFGRVHVPPAVRDEVFGAQALPNWIVLDDTTNESGAPLPFSPTLGRGEREAIALAKAVAARWVILDDLPARRAAVALGLPVVGTLGLLLAAKRRGLIPTVGPHIERLRAVEFHVADGVVAAVLEAAGEEVAT